MRLLRFDYAITYVTSDLTTWGSYLANNYSDFIFSDTVYDVSIHGLWDPSDGNYTITLLAMARN